MIREVRRYQQEEKDIAEERQQDEEEEEDVNDQGDEDDEEEDGGRGSHHDERVDSFSHSQLRPSDGRTVTAAAEVVNPAARMTGSGSGGATGQTLAARPGVLKHSHSTVTDPGTFLDNPVWK